MINRDHVVLGGGISGLATASFLAQTGEEVILLEASSHVGGCITTRKTESGFQIEEGPNTVLMKEGPMTQLVEFAGLKEALLVANPVGSRRFIARRGKPLPLPGGPFSFLTTSIFSMGAKIRLLKEPWIKPAPEGMEEPISSFVHRRLGEEFLRYAVDPFVSGVYAGDPGRLSVRYATRRIWELEQEHGSLIRGALALRKGPEPKGRMISFPDGLGQLPKALARKLGKRVSLNVRVEKVDREETGWVVNSESSEPVRAKHLWTCLPALDAVPLIAPHMEAFGECKNIPYADVAVVSLGFPRSAVSHPLDGFGLLAPEIEKRFILGCLFPSSLFPQRTPEGEVLLTAFVGGGRHPERVAMEDEALMEAVQSDVGALLGANGSPSFKSLKRWQPAIPQYNLGHGHFLALREQAEKTLSGVHIGGNVWEGVSVGDCVSCAKRKVDQVLQERRG